MANVARSMLPITTITKNGVSVGDDLIFGSGSLNVEKRIARNVTIAGVKRRIISVSGSGGFNVAGDVTETMNTSHLNSTTTPGNQDIIIVNGVMISGVITASYDRGSDQTSCQFRGTMPAIDQLGGAGVVDGTLGGVYYESL